MDVRHTAVNQFQRVPIKNFVHGVSTRETIINDLKEFMSNISGNIGIVRWIKTYIIFRFLHRSGLGGWELYSSV